MLAVALAILSCARTPLPTPPATPTTPAVREATLFYSSARLESTGDAGAESMPFPLPLVRGTIAGHATTLIVVRPV